MKIRLLSLFAILLLTATTINAQIPTNGLIAYYPFSGNAIDSSGNGNNGTVNGAILSNDRFGNTNSAYSFNGVSSYITVPQTKQIEMYQGTWNIWVKLNSPSKGKGYYFFGKRDNQNDDIVLSEYQGNCVGQYVGNGNNNTGTGLSGSTIANGWHMLTLMYDLSKTKNNLQLFCDGKANDSSTVQQLTFINGDIRFGIEENNNYWDALNGILDDALIYNRVLNNTEIQTLYHQGGYALPVSFENISAVKNGNFVNVNWQTATELNTSHFIIQHSKDGTSFTDIGTLKAVGSGANGYEFTDYTPTIGTNYYRFQSVDKDGSSSYSKVVSVNFGNNSSFAIKPNPAKDFATISFSKMVDKATIAVYDLAGKAVITKSLRGSRSSYKLDTQTLTNGVYVIKVKTDTGSYNEKLLINK
ncbi:LamG-like jellyroll fold domain-containing protein [Parasediminibacterium sp. JCM 36343]|uniref:LamG-like jellyroll fold domain-containing protein n=1 Tax=Parasediminibacterium sp. JCM 36343 TaxID=3374279 RepID=UPI00397D763E